jgi:hypothetical protein
MTKDTGGPAFPVRLPIIGAIHACDEPVPSEIHGGMSLRDYFASKAMQAILSNPDYGDEDSSLAGAAYYVADAMLKARQS